MTSIDLPTALTSIDLPIASLILEAIVLTLLLITIFQSTYYTIPRQSKDELKQDFKVKIQRTLMDVSEIEAETIADAMIEVLDQIV
jgi:hypothetical protein